MKKHICNRFGRGMTLLEVLVSMLVVGLGSAAVLSMMLASNRYGVSAEYRSTAMREIQSIIDSMRANSLGVRGYIFGTPQFQTQGYSTKTVEAKPALTCKDSNKCTTKETLRMNAEVSSLVRAQVDMQNWLAHVATSVPAGQGAIQKNKDNSYTVTVMWSNKDENQRTDASLKNSDSANMTFVL